MVGRFTGDIIIAGFIGVATVTVVVRVLGIVGGGGVTVTVKVRVIIGLAPSVALNMMLAMPVDIGVMVRVLVAVGLLVVAMLAVAMLDWLDIAVKLRLSVSVKYWARSMVCGVPMIAVIGNTSPCGAVSWLIAPIIRYCGSAIWALVVWLVVVLASCVHLPV